MINEGQPNWLTYILGLMMALLAWIGKVGWNRIGKIEDEYVSRDDFKYYMDQVREDRINMHKENVEKLDRIHDRIDGLYK